MHASATPGHAGGSAHLCVANERSTEGRIQGNCLILEDENPCPRPFPLQGLTEIEEEGI